MSLLDNLKNTFSRKPDPPPAPQKSAAELYRAALAAQRAEKDGYFRRDPYGPIENRTEFNGLNYYEADLAWRFTLPLEPCPPETLIMSTSTDDEQTYRRVGYVTFEVAGTAAQLAVYQMEDDHEHYFIPFRDATSGQTTYGGGRYLEPEMTSEGQLIVDFNLAYNPYCAYSPHFSCPLPPRENWLKVPIEAGEKSYDVTKV